MGTKIDSIRGEREEEALIILFTREMPLSLSLSISDFLISGERALSARIFKIPNLMSSFTFIMGRSSVIARQHGDVINATRKTFITLLN